MIIIIMHSLCHFFRSFVLSLGSEMLVAFRKKNLFCNLRCILYVLIKKTYFAGVFYEH